MAQVLKNGFVIDGKYVEVLHDINAFKVGDTVEVVDEFEDGFGFTNEWENSWVSDMKKGDIGEIISGSKYGFLFDNGYYYPSSVLKLVKQDNTSTMDKELIQYKLEIIVTNLVDIQNLVEEIQEQLDKE